MFKTKKALKKEIEELNKENDLLRQLMEDQNRRLEALIGMWNSFNESIYLGLTELAELEEEDLRARLTVIIKTIKQSRNETLH